MRKRDGMRTAAASLLFGQECVWECLFGETCNVYLHVCLCDMMEMSFGAVELASVRQAY